MLIHGVVEVQSRFNHINKKLVWQKSRRYRSCLSCVNLLEYSAYYLCVKTSQKSQVCVYYEVAALDHVYGERAAKGKVIFLFKRPRHRVVFQTGDAIMLNMFLRQLQSFVGTKNGAVTRRAEQTPMTVVLVKKDDDVTDRFGPASTEFIAVDHFDRRILNMVNLSHLVLENCVLPDLPEQIGHLPLTFFSLSGSKLGASRLERDTLWDWMTVNTIDRTLTTLHMDSINLMILPFEILFLKNLQTLSVSSNNLRYLPQYIGELKKLQTLFIANNKISYFPQNLRERRFINLDISNNSFTFDDGRLPSSYDHIHSYMKLLEQERSHKKDVHSLSRLAFTSVVENCIKFKRQELPRTLWHYFNIIGRCIICQKFVLPHYAYISRSYFFFPSSSNLMIVPKFAFNRSNDCVNYQVLSCQKHFL